MSDMDKVWIDTCTHDRDDRPPCRECDEEDRCLVNYYGERSVVKNEKDTLREEFAT